MSLNPLNRLNNTYRLPPAETPTRTSPASPAPQNETPSPALRSPAGASEPSVLEPPSSVATKAAVRGGSVNPQLAAGVQDAAVATLEQADSLQAEDELLMARETLANTSPEDMEELMVRVIRGEEGALSEFRAKKGELAEGFADLAGRYRERGGDPRIAQKLDSMGAKLKRMNFTGSGVRYLQSMARRLDREMDTLRHDIRGEALSNPNSFSAWELGQLDVTEQLFGALQNTLDVDTDRLLSVQKEQLIAQINQTAEGMTGLQALTHPEEFYAQLESKGQELETQLKEYLSLSGVRDPEQHPASWAIQMLQELPQLVEDGQIGTVESRMDQIMRSISAVEDPALQGALNQLNVNAIILRGLDSVQDQGRYEMMIEMAKDRYNQMGFMRSVSDDDAMDTDSNPWDVSQVVRRETEQDLIADAGDSPEDAARLEAYNAVAEHERAIKTAVSGVVEERFDRGIKRLEAMLDDNSTDLYAQFEAEARQNGVSLEEFMEIAYDASSDDIAELGLARQGLDFFQGMGASSAEFDAAARAGINQQLRGYIERSIERMQEQKDDLLASNPYALLKRLPEIREDVYNTLGFKSDMIALSLQRQGEDSFPPAVDESQLLEMIEQGYVPNETELVFLVQAEDQDDDAALEEGVLDALDFVASVGLSVVSFGAGAVYTATKAVVEGVNAEEEHEDRASEFLSGTGNFQDARVANNAADGLAIAANAAVSIALDKVDILGKALDGGKAVLSAFTDKVQTAMVPALSKGIDDGIALGLSGEALEAFATQNMYQNAVVHVLKRDFSEQLSEMEMKKVLAEMVKVDFKQLAQDVAKLGQEREWIQTYIGNKVNEQIQDGL